MVTQKYNVLGNFVKKYLYLLIVIVTNLTNPAPVSRVCLNLD